MLPPNHSEAIIPIAKTRDFLLDLNHPRGGSKAVVLLQVGFVRERWQELEAAIRDLIAVNDAVLAVDFPDGRFVVRGQLRGPAGSHVFRSVWVFDEGAVAPRFVTAYPR